jgi:hypothetical protein
MSTIIPAASLAINSNISTQTLSKIQTQLNIDEVIYIEDLIASIELNSNYLSALILSNKRALILYKIDTTIDLYSLGIDVICRVKNGLISILNDKVPGQTYKIPNLSWDKLKIYLHNRS